MSEPEREEEGEIPEGVAPTGSHRIQPATALMIAILLLLGLGTSILRIGWPTRAQPSDVDLSVPSWHLAPDEIVGLAKNADARRKAMPASDAKEVKQLLEAFRVFNASDLKHRGDQRSEALQNAHADYQQWARTLSQFLGTDAFMGLGQTLADEFISALKRGNNARVQELSGSYSIAMRATGLIDESGRPVSSQAWRIAELGFLTYWCQTILPLRPIDTLLGPQERIALLRWKLAANPLLRPERRLALGQALEAMGSTYPWHEAIAARAANEGNWSTAATYYRVASEASPENSTLRANAALAEAKSSL